MSLSQRIQFTPVDNARLQNLCGPLDENLKQIETALDVSIARRGEGFKVVGARAADAVLPVPAQTMADDQGERRSSVLPMGSLFEGALFVLFEVMVLRLIERLQITPEAMRANHTPLE